MIFLIECIIFFFFSLNFIFGRWKVIGNFILCSLIFDCEVFLYVLVEILYSFLFFVMIMNVGFFVIR